jgi:hypothetical protein
VLTARLTPEITIVENEVWALRKLNGKRITKYLTPAPAQNQSKREKRDCLFGWGELAGDPTCLASSLEAMEQRGAGVFSSFALLCFSNLWRSPLR